MSGWTVRHADASDRDFWFRLDRHMPESLFTSKAQAGQLLLLEIQGRPAAILRWNLFWDNTPFCNLLIVEENEQGKGYGRALMTHWENEMRGRGYDLVMTSTQADETAQHFYRKLGYRDCGGFVLPFPGHEQPTELILAKEL